MSQQQFTMDSYDYTKGASAAQTFAQDVELRTGQSQQFSNDWARMQALTGRQQQLATQFPNLWCRFFTITNSTPAAQGPPLPGWGTEIGTPGPQQVNFGVGNFNWGGRLSNVGLVAKGYVFASDKTTIVFRTIADDGAAIWFNGSNVLSNWTTNNPAATTTTNTLVLPKGYTPVEIHFFNWANGATSNSLQLLVDINNTGYTTASPNLFQNASSKENTTF